MRDDVGQSVNLSSQPRRLDAGDRGSLIVVGVVSGNAYCAKEYPVGSPDQHPTGHRDERADGRTDAGDERGEILGPPNVRREPQPSAIAP